MATPLRLLQIEDSQDDAEIIRLELEKAGYALQWKRVDSEIDFTSALSGETWDVIISDFRMPDFDGLSAFRLLKGSGLDVPFIFVSGALGEDRAVEAMRAGARDYLLKENLARLAVAVTRELEAARIRRTQRFAEEAARREQRRLAMAVAASGAGIFEHEVPLGPAAYVSPRCAEILGSTPENVPSGVDLESWVQERIHPDDRSLARKSYLDILEGRSKGSGFEARFRHESGHWIDVAVFAKEISRNEDRRARGVVGVVLDLGERKRLEAQFLQAQKMEAVGRLAGGIAHDFNNLLTVILSFGEFVRAELPPDAGAHRDVEEILKAAKRAEDLTRQLLTFSRRKVVSPRVLSLNETVNDMKRMLERLLGEDIELHVELAPALGLARLDSSAFEQVIANLAVNARDAMPGGGRLSLRTTNADLSEPLESSDGVIPGGRYIVLVVSDEGTGMEASTLARLFEPFFTTKEPGRGTGLGLATCYGIVKQAGGHVTVESELGRGTTFSIFFPRVFEDSAPVTSQEREQGSEARGSERILVVEDEAQVRMLARRVLERLGYTVADAANDEQAIAQCERDEPFHLLLTDVVMPGLGGKKLSERLLELQPGIKVLYMSGYDAGGVFDRGVIGPDARLVEKPFTPQSLARAVREALDA